MAKQTNTKRKTTTNNNQPGDLQTRKAEEVAQRLAATPFTLMKRFTEEMESLFDDFGFDRNWLTPLTQGTTLAQGPWHPQVEMFERGNEIVVHADLPGLTKDDVKVEIADGGITIEGERKNDNEVKGQGYYRSERSYGKFSRHLPLPDGVNSEDANATFRNGVLEVTLPAPQRAERKPRRLEISGEGQHQRARGKAA
jgi:HSP20 family protein